MTKIPQPGDFVQLRSLPVGALFEDSGDCMVVGEEFAGHHQMGVRDLRSQYPYLMDYDREVRFLCGAEDSTPSVKEAARARIAGPALLMAFEMRDLSRDAVDRMQYIGPIFSTAVKIVRERWAREEALAEAQDGAAE